MILNKGLIGNLIQIYKQEELSPEALLSHLSTKGVTISWKALMNRWNRE